MWLFTQEQTQVSPSLPTSSQNAIVVEAGGQQGEGEGAELDAGPTVEFVLELHPEKEEHTLYQLEGGLC